MRVFLVAVTVCILINNSETTTSTQSPPLRCRRCEGANSLDECTVSITCAADEICYMDQIITDAYAISYNGGCRARNVCKKRPPGVRKREEATGLVACSRCCDIVHNPECNSKLCGISGSKTSNSQCYSCPDGVDKADQCMTLTSCQSDEVCGAETFRSADSFIHTFTCLNKRLCILLTQEAIKRMKECRNSGFCPIIGKRSVSGDKRCTSCCGDALCNADKCEEVLNQLYNLWDNNVLDFNTLKRKPNSTATVGK